MTEVKRYNGRMSRRDTAIPAGFMYNMVKGEDYDALQAKLQATEKLLMEQIDSYERVATVLTRDPYDDRDGVSFHIDDLKRLMALPSGTTLYIKVNK